MKTAELAVLGPVLMEERDAGIVELLEKLVPADPIEAFIRRIEIDPQNACMSVLFRCLHGRGLATAFFRPSSNDVMAVCRASLSCVFE